MREATERAERAAAARGAAARLRDARRGAAARPGVPRPPALTGAARARARRRCRPSSRASSREALRELLIALRAVLDYSIDRLEPGPPADRRRRWRTSRSPDRLGVVPSLQKRVRAIPPEQRMAAIAAAALWPSRWSLPWYRSRYSSTRARERARLGEPERVRRLHVRRGGGAARRGRRAVPRSGRAGGQGLPPAGRRRARDLARRRLGGAAADLARCSTGPDVDGPASTVGIQWGFFVALLAARRRWSPRARACAPRTGPSRRTRPRTSTGSGRAAPAPARERPRGRATRPRSPRCCATGPAGTASRPTRPAASGAAASEPRRRAPPSAASDRLF